MSDDAHMQLRAMEAESMINPRAVAGANSFRELCANLNAQLPTYLAEENAMLLAMTQTLKAEYESAPMVVDTDDLEKQLTTLGVKLKKFISEVDTQRKADKAPPYQTTKMVDDFFNAMTAVIQPRFDAVAKRVNTYKDAKRLAERQRVEEEQRRARETKAEADRLAAAAKLEEEAPARKEAEQLAAAKVAEAKAAEKSARTTVVTAAVTEDGAKSGQRLDWTGEIVSLEELDLNALRHIIPRPVLETAVRTFASRNKDTVPLAGARIFEKSTTTFK